MAIHYPKVLVMMSTYNGESYIEEQIESILIQEEVEVQIAIRDDGSKDKTVQILTQYAHKYPLTFTLFIENNIGVKRSFFELIKHVDEKYDYYAFCDQDDVWLPNKLSRAIQSISSSADVNTPVLYCSSTQMVDQKLSSISIWPEQPKKESSIYNALIENICVGCTSVLNANGFRMIRDTIPLDITKIIMHDWWIYLTISTFGKVVFDSTPSILYRQHQNNVLGGASDSIVLKWKKRVIRFITGQNHFILTQQAVEFRKVCIERFDQQHLVILDRFIKYSNSNFLKRISYVLTTRLYRQSTIDNLIFKLIFIAGKV